MMDKTDEVRTEEDARCIAAEFAARHNQDERRAKEYASSWFNMGGGCERKTGALEGVLKWRLGVRD
jgi:hypothetical protein